ncbi:hypothetical protein PENTCL1PPCAC_26148 [Pristionchus entomophagus]|uniref:Importin N-terminal domain-containing protein n=1 Tax=Pristionchus entomophagus TaxID=358040 RepID=A0AAV5UC72_9BILA|nr:hypothetical protein PENTCL1PPCAC_26148 [Pristionchus entomophagus]
MDGEKLKQALVATTVAEDQKQAEQYLQSNCLPLAGFAPTLLRIIVDPSSDDTLAITAVTYFKNTVTKHWKRDEDLAESESQFVLSDEDKAFVRENIVDAICNTANVTVRNQLCYAVQTVARCDFPESWPSLPAKVATLLHTDNAAHMLGAFLVLYKLCKIYEYKRTTERKVLLDMMQPLMPLLFQRLIHLMPNDSNESILLQKIIVKILYCLTQFSLNLEFIPADQLDGWLNICREILLLPPPSSVDVSDPEEAERHEHWRLKKWAAKVLERTFERYGAPGQVESSYAEFAQHFLANHSIPCVEAFLQQLASRQTGTFVSNRVIHLALSFLTTGVSHSHVWKVIKPHFLSLSEHVIFPLLCHTEDDEAMWEDDVEEYIRFKYDIFEDLNNPCNSASSLLVASCKRKDMIQPVLSFIVQTLVGRANEPVAVDGAMRMAGELAAQLTTSKKYKKDCEKLLDAHVIPRLTHESRFVRARAACTLKQFTSCQFNTPRILKSVIDGVVARMLTQEEELPVKVEAALCVQYMLDEQDDKACEFIKPHVAQIIPNVLKLISTTHVEELCGVVDEMMDKFMEEVVPAASLIAAELSDLFLNVIASDQADEMTPTLMSVISTLANILDVVDDHKEIMVAVEGSVLRIVKAVFLTANIDYYDDVLMLVQSLVATHVSVPMWDVFHDIYTAFMTGNNSVIIFADVTSVLHLYITTDTEQFLARPERLNCVLEMCKVVIEDENQGDDNQLAAMKILEILVLQCGRGIQEAIPLILTLTLNRMTKPFEGLTELQPMCCCVMVACVYMVDGPSVAVLSQLASLSSPPIHGLDLIANQLIFLNNKFEGVHSRKMALLGWCLLLRQNAEQRPAAIGYDPKKVLEQCITLFEGLQKAMKLQAEVKAMDESDSEDESEGEDEDDEEEMGGGGGGKGKKNRHRKMDDDLGDSEDEIDEGTLEYLENLTKVQESSDDEEGEDGEDAFVEETDTEVYETSMDGEDSPDIFVLFKETMEGFEKNEPTLFAQMVNTLDADTAERLKSLITECGRHAALADSRKLENTGGYQFNMDAPVPSTFNFGG